MRPLRWGASGFTTMDALARTGPRRITDLADAEHVSQPGMTGLIGRRAVPALAASLKACSASQAPPFMS